jgi:hypothetical protein
MLSYKKVIKIKEQEKIFNKKEFFIRINYSV